MKIFCLIAIIYASLKLKITSSYKLLDRYYDNNIIDIHVSTCPPNIDCITMLFEANSILQVPGNYRHVNWFFNARETPTLSDNGINEIIFKHTHKHKGKTEFKVLNGKVLEFNMIIDPYKLTNNTLYNVILHELAHVYLLGHSEYKDSVMGYKLDVYNDKIIQATEKIYLTNDDCLGLYDKLIKDMYNNNNQYKSHLQKTKNIHCSNFKNNYILEDPNKITPSILQEPKNINMQQFINQWAPLNRFNHLHFNSFPRYRPIHNFRPRISLFRENDCCSCEDLSNIDDKDLSSKVSETSSNKLHKRGFNIHRIFSGTKKIKP